MEDNERIAEYYGRLFLLDRPVVTIEKYIEEIDSVTSDEIYEVCQSIITPDKINLALVGNIKENDAKTYLSKMQVKWNTIINKMNMNVASGGGNSYSEDHFYPQLLAQGQITSQFPMFGLNGF
jgi:predicted Zn-dependent peptidase